MFIGKSGQLLEDIAVPDKEQLEANINAVKNFAQTYENIPTTVMLVPDAACILSNRLPAFATVEDQRQMFGMVERNLGDTVNWVDTVSIMNKHKSEKLYYKTDHHWTTLGAYYGYQALAAAMKLDTSKAPAMKSYAVTNSFNGTLSATSGYETDYNEPIYIYAPDDLKTAPQVVVNNVNEKKKTATLYDTSKLKEKDKYALFLGGNYPVLDIRTTADTTDRLLLVKDSYANSVIPFLTAYYREIIVVRSKILL